MRPSRFWCAGCRQNSLAMTMAAERAFEAAQWRDPRSLPAAYFLADRYFQTGDMRSTGSREVAALARLSPSGIVDGCALPCGLRQGSGELAERFGGCFDRNPAWPITPDQAFGRNIATAERCSPWPIHARNRSGRAIGCQL